VLGGVFLLAFGPCAPPRCSAGAAVAAVVTGLVLAAATGLGGLALTVRRIVLRRAAWPAALLTLVVCVAVVVATWAGHQLVTGV
jgi:hypothetical protein